MCDTVGYIHLQLSSMPPYRLLAKSHDSGPFELFYIPTLRKSIRLFFIYVICSVVVPIPTEKIPRSDLQFGFGVASLYSRGNQSDRKTYGQIHTYIYKYIIILINPFRGDSKSPHAPFANDFASPLNSISLNDSNCHGM